MKYSFANATISGVAVCIPDNKISLEDQVEELFNGNAKRIELIQKSLGWKNRHIANRLTTLDLCYNASKNLLTNLKINNEEIDGIVFVTQTPDFSQPGNSHLLHQKLQLNSESFAIDINQGCSGYIYGLYLGFMMIETGANNILLCSGDTLSKIIDQKNPNIAPFFGDAGSATLIQRKPNKSFFCLHADGRGWKEIHLANNTKHHSNFLFMNGGEVFNNSLKYESIAIEELLNFSCTKPQEIDLAVFHQGNAYIIQNVAKKTSLTNAPTYPTSKYANTSSASIPLSLCDIANTEFNGSIKTKNLIFSAFGVGFSWANCLIDNSNITCLKPILLKE